MNIFLGKFINRYPEQIEKKYFSGGPEGSSWYGGMNPGDYAFIAYEGKIIGLWKAREYTKMRIGFDGNEHDILQFDEIKKYTDISVANDFTRYKYFIHDLNLVNKSVKMLKGTSFIPIHTTVDIKNPEDIEFRGNEIDIYIALESAGIPYKQGDIRVRIDGLEEMRILQIERFMDGAFSIYKEFNEFYRERNKKDTLFTIKELYNYAIEDNAPMKKNFLTTLIDELNENGFMKITNAVKLYDNVLVGRKRSSSAPGNDNSPKDEHGIPDDIEEEEDPEASEISGEYGEYASLLNFNPNIILYGPPGTGKTYSTQKIIDAFERKYFDSKSGYESAQHQGRVRNITFHQSYSYEEFIEGIRPVLDDTGAGKVGYKLENGLFKEFCINAEKEILRKQDNASYIEMIGSQSVVWKVSLGERRDDKIFNECIASNDIAIHYSIEEDISGWDYDSIYAKLQENNDSDVKPTQDANTVNALVNEMAAGDIVMIYDGPRTIRMMGMITSDYRFDPNFSYNHRRSVFWFKDLEYPIDIFKNNGSKNLTMKTIYALNKINVSDIIELIINHSKAGQTSEDRRKIKPYYMIIDEINRGNISKIFGELITLIEQDKRGKLKSCLPYSKKEFTIPSNLYMIGTMNTADRSIAAIDTALRRRFTFVEIEPDASVLAQFDNYKVNDHVDLLKLMESMNQKIQQRYDRDHRIGHAYFMGIETLNNLYQTWYYKILPLLNEYFYNDLEALEYVVGKGFFDEYGNIKYASLGKKDNGLTEFEEKLLRVYGES